MTIVTMAGRAKSIKDISEAEERIRNLELGRIISASGDDEIYNPYDDDNGNYHPVNALSPCECLTCKNNRNRIWTDEEMKEIFEGSNFPLNDDKEPIL